MDLLVAGGGGTRRRTCGPKCHDGKYSARECLCICGGKFHGVHHRGESLEELVKSLSDVEVEELGETMDISSLLALRGAAQEAPVDPEPEVETTPAPEKKKRSRSKKKVKA